LINFILLLGFIASAPAWLLFLLILMFTTEAERQ
jgi:hypothetical protein